MALIDRGALMIDYLERLGKSDSYKSKFEALGRAVDSAPAVDAEPVRHGRWKKDPYHGTVVVCGECHAGCFNKNPYCPLCGAKMDLEGE